MTGSAFRLILGILIGISVNETDISYCLTKNFSCCYLDGWQQDIVDSGDYGAHFNYGEFGNDCYADHNNQRHKNLKLTKINDKLWLIKNGKYKVYQCVHIETDHVDSAGQIRDVDGLYMGDAWTPCVILYTCQGKDRLVTIWKEIEK